MIELRAGRSSVFSCFRIDRLCQWVDTDHTLLYALTSFYSSHYEQTALKNLRVVTKRGRNSVSSFTSAIGVNCCRLIRQRWTLQASWECVLHYFWPYLQNAFDRHCEVKTLEDRTGTGATKIESWCFILFGASLSFFWRANTRACWGRTTGWTDMLPLRFIVTFSYIRKRFPIFLKYTFITCRATFSWLYSDMAIFPAVSMYSSNWIFKYIEDNIALQFDLTVTNRR